MIGSSSAPAGVEAAGIVNDKDPLKRIYDPGHPDADANGYVVMPNVNPVSEMVDLIDASRAYQANVRPRFRRPRPPSAKRSNCCDDDPGLSRHHPAIYPPAQPPASGPIAPSAIPPLHIRW